MGSGSAPQGIPQAARLEPTGVQPIASFWLTLLKSISQQSMKALMTLVNHQMRSAQALRKVRHCARCGVRASRTTESNRLLARVWRSGHRYCSGGVALSHICAAAAPWWLRGGWAAEAPMPLCGTQPHRLISPLSPHCFITRHAARHSTTPFGSAHLAICAEEQHYCSTACSCRCKRGSTIWK